MRLYVATVPSGILSVMTVPVGHASGETGRFDGDDGREAPSDRAVSVARGICPYLTTTEGSWVSADPSRDHRCSAVVPPVQPGPDKQRRLCLAAAHAECATFVAARELHATGVDERDEVPWRFARALPVVLDPGRSPAALVARARGRGLGQLGLVGLMAVAFATVVVARGLAPAAPTTAVADPSTAASLVPPSPTPLPSLAPSPSPEVSPSPSPDVSPTPPPSNVAATYRVRSGDTLLGIAQEFGTTVKVLQELNGIEDPKLIRVGQIIQLP